MITAINSATTFKSIYQLGKMPLSCAQEKTLEQIRDVVEIHAPKDNFIVEPLGRTQLGLAKVKNLHKETNFADDEFSFTRKDSLHIGTYDVNKPFAIEDIEKAETEYNKFMTRRPMIIVGSVFGAIMVGLLTLSSIQKPKNVEKVVDTITTKVDTLKSANILKH